MKQKADRKKAIRRLTVLSRRLQILGVVLAIVGIGSAVQLLRTEIPVKPEPTMPTQIETTEETTVSAATTAAETSAATEASSADTTPAASEATTVPAETVSDSMSGAEILAVDGEDTNAIAHDSIVESSGRDDTAQSDNAMNERDSDTLTSGGTTGEEMQSSSNANTNEGEGNQGNDFKKTEPTGSTKADLAIQNGAEITRWNPPFPNLRVESTAPVPDIAELPEEKEKPVNLWLILAIVSDGLLILDLIAIAVVQRKLKKLEQEADIIPITEKIPWHAVPPKIGKVHGIGGRDYQQDSLGHTQVLNGGGALAIVADGMGGLSNGEQVSQQIVMDGLGYGAAMTRISEGNPLLGMVRQINAGVNRMLGPEGIYKCGSTLIAVLIAQDQFHWVSVGDSRIYLYRAGYVNQLNTDHDLFQQWMPEILAGTRSYAEAARNPDGRKLTSFIGMGELKYVDYSRQPIDLAQGDRLILVTDGVYGAVPPEQLAEILKANPEVSTAARVLERRILGAKMPHQDNYTALILGF